MRRAALTVDQWRETLIRSIGMEPAALDEAVAQRRPAIVEFAADWCLPCIEMKGSTFADADVLRESERFSWLQADVTASNSENDQLLKEFAVLGVPTIIFYDAKGREVERAVGFVDAERFRELMRSVGASGGGGGGEAV